MISTGMWNKMWSGSGVALAATAATKSFLDSLIGLTVAQLRTVAGVLATADVTYSGFGIVSTRSAASAYARTTVQKADTTSVAPWDTCASGKHTAVVFALLENGVVTRCMAMPCTYNRGSISIDDPLGGQLRTGGQAGQVLEVSSGIGSSSVSLSGMKLSLVSSGEGSPDPEMWGTFISGLAVGNGVQSATLGAV